MHAFVIGVAGYPDAKKGKGYEALLRGVQDVPCATASARRIADWLMDNRDRLTPPLASLGLLLSDAPADPGRKPYPMRFQPQGQTVEKATKANVVVHGQAWVDRFKPGDSAFFFISGHGAMKDNDAVVFLEDLNGDRAGPWDAHLNVSELAQALRVDDRLKAAVFFSDACQEYSARFREVKPGAGARIVTAADVLRLVGSRDKVAFVTAASQGLETLEGDWMEADRTGDPAVKMGRFTQVLIEALDGASARRLDGKWVVHPKEIEIDLKNLYRLRGWTDLFEPSQPLTQNEKYPFVEHQNPKVPLVVRTDPTERLPGCSLEIFMPYDRTAEAIASCKPGPPRLWAVRLAASVWTHALVVEHSGQERVVPFTPNEPIFVQTIALP